MCGINGLIGNHSPDIIKKMNEVTKRRGPDGSYCYTDENISLGHNLLSVMSKEPVIQPFHFNNGILVFNGAIFNFRELGYEGDSDTEVLARGIDAEGKDFLLKCRGMWAFAWYKNKKLLLSRDHFGVKPLYYSRSGNSIAQFSSSIMALNSDRKLNVFAFSLFRHFGHVPGYLTLFKDCYKLVPGEVIELDIEKEKITTDNLWKDYDFTPDQKYDPKEWLNRLEKAIVESKIGYRKRGVLLSGGLDSTSIGHYLGEKNTFTTRYTDTDERGRYNNDANIAKQFAKDYQFNHTEIEINPENFVDSIDYSLEALELVLANRSNPSYWYVNKQLKKAGTVVVYSGDGGDEMYCGYGNHNQYGNHTEPFRDYFRVWAWLSKKRLRLVKGEELSENKFVEYMASWFPTNPWREDHANNCLFIEMITRVSEDFLTRNDKLGSYFGMESRFPLLNQEWYRYNMKIPSSIKLKKGATEKYLPSSGLSSVLPDYVINKPKTGWSIPEGDWRKKHSILRGKMLKMIKDPTNNELDNLVYWGEAKNNFKTFWPAAFLKRWFKIFGVKL